MQTTDYHKQATDLLEKFGVKFSVERVGHDCPMFCEDAEKQRDMDKITKFPRNSHIHGAHYRAFFTRENPHRQFSVDFWNSYADEEFNALGTKRHQYGETMLKYDLKGKRKVTAYDVLSCIQKNDVGTFEYFCDEFGYDPDSRKAERTYQAVLAEWSKVAAFFTFAELEQLQEVQ